MRFVMRHSSLGSREAPSSRRKRISKWRMAMKDARILSVHEFMSYMLRFHDSRLSKPFHCDAFEGPEIQLACSQYRQRIDLDEIPASRKKEIGNAGGRRFGHNGRNLRVIEGMKNGQLFAFALVRNPGHGKDLSLKSSGLVQGFFHSPMRHHLAADFGKTRQPVGDGDESIFVDRRNVTGDIPAVLHGRGGEVFPAEIADHDIRTLDQ